MPRNIGGKFDLEASIRLRFGGLDERSQVAVVRRLGAIGQSAEIIAGWTGLNVTVVRVVLGQAQPEVPGERT